MEFKYKYGASVVDIPHQRATPADTKQMDGYFIQWSRKLTGTRGQVLLRWLSTATVRYGIIRM